jgi:integrase
MAMRAVIWLLLATLPSLSYFLHHHHNLIILFDLKNWSNPRIRLAVMTARLVGLRARKIRGIKWRDIDKTHDVIRVDRELIDIEGEKLPKWGKTRITM